MTVAAQFEEFDRRAEQLRRLARFGFPFVRRAVARSFPARTNTERDLAPARRFREKNSAAAKLDIVRVSAENEEADLGFRHQERRRGRTARLCRE